MDADRNGVDAAPSGRLSPDARVGDYRIKALIGEGAMGEVYLAQDLVLGRRVAVKLVRSEGLAAGVVERFLEEARATATFAHPHIVTLYAVGSHEGRPYLALEFLDGESLRARLAQGPLPERDALRTMRAIAEAVAEAHERGIVHADLKPENVMVPRDGRLRVVDFGLARLAGTATTAASGTPSYMAPERWTRGVPDGAIDVWSLGVMLHELCTGARPWTDAELGRMAFSKDDPPLPPRDDAWAPLVRDCLRRGPTARPSAAQVVQRLTGLLEPVAVVEGEVACPFPGLVAFGRGDAAHYFGRVSELDHVVEALRRAPLIPIAGPSGVGKSSFVTAAVAPRLEESGAWTTVRCRPGATPFVSLAAALDHGDAAELRAEPTRVALALAACAQRAKRRVLLVVDQFEECFTLAGDEGVALCAALAEAARADEPWRVVLTVRDDFLARLASVPAVQPHLGALVMLTPMTLTDLRAAVRGPLANVGYTTDTEALLGSIASDVANQPASLALLQFACRALWERRDVAGRRLLTSEYAAIGGASGALATHAERVLGELTLAQVRQVRSVFLDLVAADGTRRPRPRRMLEDGHLGDVGAVIDALVDRRLLVSSRQLDDDEPLIEIAHEALATAWPRLGRWLDETHEERLLLAEVEQAATLWSQRGERDEETWTGPALTETLRKVESWAVLLPSESRRFLIAGKTRTDRRRRVRRWVTGIVAGALVAATVVAVLVAVRIARSERIAQAQKREVLSQQEQIKLAAADMGRFELVLEPFDWDPKEQEALAPAVRPTLTWKLRAPSAEDIDEPGREYVEGDDLRRGSALWQDGALVETVEARSGRVFLEVDRGAACAPSLVAIQRLPGFQERRDPRTLRLAVPTCQASMSDTIKIPAGRFWRSTQDPADEAKSIDEVAYMPEFRIRATEETRGMFASYLSMKEVTGDTAVSPQFLQTAGESTSRLPAVGFPYATARRYCRYLGLDVASVDQWQKAFRGGEDKFALDDPRASRQTVWVTAASKRPTNIAYDYPTLARIRPARSFPDDRSPYDVFDMAGNVAEWTRTTSVGGKFDGLQVVLGADWGTPPRLGNENVSWQNTRAALTVEFGIGVRCVLDNGSGASSSRSLSYAEDR